MQKILTYVVFFIFTVNSNIYSQQNEPFKKCNTIIIEFKDSIPMQNILQYAVLNGYTIIESNETLKYYSLKKRMDEYYGDLNVTLNILIINNKILVTGLLEKDIIKPTRINFTTLKGTIYKVAWDEMDKIAKSYPAGVITYEMH